MTRNGRNSKGWRMRAGILSAIGVALAGASLPATAAVGPSLGAARSFAVLGSSTVSNTGGTTLVTGDVGVSPGSSIVGFGPGQVTGGTYVGGQPEADNAHSDASLAYDFLEGMASIPANNLTSLDLGGMTLAPAVYKYNTSAQLTGDLVLDAGGDSAAVFVFQIGSTLTTASGATVKVINGGADYDESNVFWQVGSSATLGSGTAFTGNILAYADITIVAGSSMTGNALAIGGAVTLDSNAVTSPPAAPAVTKAPINLTAVMAGTPSSPGADLSWNDASDNETEFRVFRRDGSGPDFVLLATIPSTDGAGIGGLVTYQDPLLGFSTTYTYRVTAFGADGESAPSNEALLDTGVVVPAVLAPINLTAALNATAVTPGADLSWTDASDNETEFRVFRRDGIGPDFVQVGTVVSTDTAGTDGVVTYLDPLLDFSMTYTYRVTAYNLADGESPPSNEALVNSGVVPPARWLTIHLGRGRNIIREQHKARMDHVRIKGSYALIDIDTSVPTVVNDLDPRISGITIQVKAPGNMVLLNVPAGDPRWKASKKGVYRWTTNGGRDEPSSSIRIDTRKSEFTFKSSRNDFGAVPVGAVTVTLTCESYTGSDVRIWDKPKTLVGGTRAMLTLPR